MNFGVKIRSNRGCLGPKKMKEEKLKERNKKGKRKGAYPLRWATGAALDQSPGQRYPPTNAEKERNQGGGEKIAQICECVLAAAEIRLNRPHSRPHWPSYQPPLGWRVGTRAGR